MLRSTSPPRSSRTGMFHSPVAVPTSGVPTSGVPMSRVLGRLIGDLEVMTE